MAEWDIIRRGLDIVTDKTKKKKKPKAEQETAQPTVRGLIIHICTAVVDESEGSNPVEALIFFQASSFQLLKLEYLLR